MPTMTSKTPLESANANVKSWKRCSAWERPRWPRSGSIWPIPSYSAVRTILGLLAKKGWLKHRHEGKRYLYRPAVPKQQSQRTALGRLLGTFFDGSPGDAVAALLDYSAGSLSDDELGRLTELIDKARRENRKTP